MRKLWILTGNLFRSCHSLFATWAPNYVFLDNKHCLTVVLLDVYTTMSLNKSLISLSPVIRVLYANSATPSVFGHKATKLLLVYLNHKNISVLYKMLWPTV